MAYRNVRTPNLGATVHDVRALAPDPRTLTLNAICEALGITNYASARTLRVLAIEHYERELAAQQAALAKPPTREQRAMAALGLSESEARYLLDMGGVLA